MHTCLAVAEQSQGLDIAIHGSLNFCHLLSGAVPKRAWLHHTIVRFLSNYKRASLRQYGIVHLSDSFWWHWSTQGPPKNRNSLKHPSPTLQNKVVLKSWGLNLKASLCLQAKPSERPLAWVLENHFKHFQLISQQLNVVSPWPWKMLQNFSDPTSAKQVFKILKNNICCQLANAEVRTPQQNVPLHKQNQRQHPNCFQHYVYKTERDGTNHRVKELSLVPPSLSDAAWKGQRLNGPKRCGHAGTWHPTWNWQQPSLTASPLKL